MPAIDTWLRQPAAQATAWALLQFLWQGAAIALLAGAALLALRRSAADVRYIVSSIALALMLTMPVVTGVQKFRVIVGAPQTAADMRSQAQPAGSPAVRPESPNPRPSAGNITRAVSAPLGRFRAVPVERAAPALLLFWLAGVSILSVRLFTGWLCVQRLRTRGIAAADDDCRVMAARLVRRLHITRAVTLLQSSLVEVPTVIGFMKPIVLLPASVLGGLAPSQLEAILAHELAHIRRHDYLVNLLQTLVETALFYHPAVWWLSRRIRIERENCCDDLAVSLCGDPVAYAAALADLEALRAPGSDAAPHWAMAATGGSLLQRVQRVLGAPSHAGRAPAWLAATAALSLIGCVAYSSPADRRAAPAGPATAVTRTLGDEVRLVNGAVHQALQRTVQRTLQRTMQRAVRVFRPVRLHAFASQGATRVVRETSVPNGNWIWSNNGDRLEVSYSGRLELTDDDSDVRQISAGGWLKISDGRWLGRHSVEIRERNGQIEHLYYVNGAARPYEPEGRAWLQQRLPRFVRGSGFGADARVARMLKSGGPAAVMAEIGRLDSTYVKGVYFRQLFKQAPLTAEQYRDAMARAAREMRSSSYELAQMLLAASENLPNDTASRAAYFEAASAIDSDYELRRVYSTMLRRGAVASATLAGILATAKHIDSDYELGQLLREIVSQQTLDERHRAAFFDAVATMDSAYERHHVLSAVVRRQGATDAAMLESALAAARTLGSDYETSQFLQEVLRQNGVEGSVRAPFFAAANSIGSGYERGRVLQAVVAKPGVSDDSLGAVLQSARAMDGYELSQVLQRVASTRALTGDLREAYLRAADRLSGYEQEQVMTALVRSERRK